VLIAVVVIAVVNGRAPGEYDEIAQCLTDKGVREYSASWCPNCARQKEMFGNSYRFLDVKECAIRGQGSNLTLCEPDGITGVPTWERADGERLVGVQTPKALAEWSGCFTDPIQDTRVDVIDVEASGDVTITPVDPSVQ